MRIERIGLPKLARLQRIGLLVGLGGAVLASGAAFLQPRHFFPAYLVTFLFFMGIPLGCLAISLLHHLTGGIGECRFAALSSPPPTRCRCWHFSLCLCYSV